MWLGVTSRMDTKNACVQKKIGMCAQIMITIIGSIVNITKWGEGDLYDHLTSKIISTLITTQDIHIIPKIAHNITKLLGCVF
jgi:hypothetical protein